MARDRAANPIAVGLVDPVRINGKPPLGSRRVVRMQIHLVPSVRGFETTDHPPSRPVGNARESAADLLRIPALGVRPDPRTAIRRHAKRMWFR